MPESSTFSRRRFVRTSLGLATAVKLQRAAQTLGLVPKAEVCRLISEQEIGPYYVPDELLRSDITEGKPGVPLSLRIIVLRTQTLQTAS